MSNILSAFNDHFMEFLNDVQQAFPENLDILSAKNALITIRKANPKMIVKIWKVCIADKYRSYINDGNIDFFINKDYTSDINGSASSDKIMESIDRLRTPVMNMDPSNQAKVMKYIQNLTKLSDLCS